MILNIKIYPLSRPKTPNKLPTFTGGLTDFGFTEKSLVLVMREFVLSRFSWARFGGESGKIRPKI